MQQLLFSHNIGIFIFINFNLSIYPSMHVLMNDKYGYIFCFNISRNGIYLNSLPFRYIMSVNENSYKTEQVYSHRVAHSVISIRTCLMFTLNAS